MLLYPTRCTAFLTQRHRFYHKCAFHGSSLVACSFSAACRTPDFSNRLPDANTVSRWESGRNVQTAAMDMLLRLIRDLPGHIEYLRARAA